MRTVCSRPCGLAALKGRKAASRGCRRGGGRGLGLGVGGVGGRGRDLWTLLNLEWYSALFRHDLQWICFLNPRAESVSGFCSKNKMSASFGGNEEWGGGGEDEEKTVIILLKTINSCSISERRHSLLLQGPHPLFFGSFFFFSSLEQPPPSPCFPEVHWLCSVDPLTW